MNTWFSKFVAVMIVVAMAAGAVAETTSLDAKAVDGILVFESPDSQFKWWIDARVYADLAMYMDDAPLWHPGDDPENPEYAEDRAELQDSLAGGFMLRRVRFALKSQFWGNWSSEIDLDFAEEGVGVKDAFIGYNGLFNGNGRVRVGNFRMPLGLEEQTSSRYLMFMERSQGTEPFVAGRRMGLEVTRWARNYRITAAAFGGDVEDWYKESNENVSFAARLNYTPIHTEDSVLLLGAAGTMQKPTFVDFDIKVNTRPETNVSDTKFVKAKYKDVDTYNVFGGELVYSNKRFLAQAEYMLANYTFLDDQEDVSNSGGYAFLSYFLTDDRREYSYADAEFARVVPRSTKGAWEIAARFSTVDLNDEDAGQMNGSSTSYTLGVNYYPNANVKMMLNYGIVDNDEHATGTGDFYGDYDFQYLSMRFQTVF
jgi:phosphate-selective porin OprO/OprP